MRGGVCSFLRTSFTGSGIVMVASSAATAAASTSSGAFLCLTHSALAPSTLIGIESMARWGWSRSLSGVGCGRTTVATSTFESAQSPLSPVKPRPQRRPSGAASQRTFGGAISDSAMAAAARGGLEVVTEGATPTEGGMTLYLKAGPDGESAGDCPFAHLVRMVFHIKDLPYDLRPCASDDDKPSWLRENYGGSMPALRHRAECYVESDVIAQYLDFFFPNPPLSLPSAERRSVDEAMGACDGFFPALAKYLKHTPDGDEEDAALRGDVENALQFLEDRLTAEGRTGPYFVGDGECLTLVDCALAPKLYHMQVGLDGFKGNAIDVRQRFPALRNYMDVMFALDSFRQTQYPEETVLWGWGNARSK